MTMTLDELSAKLNDRFVAEDKYQAELREIVEKSFTKSTAIVPVETKTLTKVEKVDAVPATLEEPALAKVTNMEIAGVPAGAILVSGFVAVLATELIDGFMVYKPKAGASAAEIVAGEKTNSIIRGAVKIGGAVAAAKFGGKVFGKTGTLVLVALLAFDGVRDIVPLDQYAKKVATSLTKKSPTQGLAQYLSNRDATPAQTARRMTDYYAAAEGR